MECPICGEDNEDTFNYCPSCGRKLNKPRKKSNQTFWGTIRSGLKDTRIRKGIGLLIVVAGIIFSVRYAYTSMYTVTNSTAIITSVATDTLPTEPVNPLPIIGIVGLGTFLSMLVGTYLITDNWDLGDGEFRKAITISIISVFFILLSFGDKIQIENLTNVTNATSAAVVSTNILSGLFTNFWAVLIAVVGFYFATRIIENKGS